MIEQAALTVREIEDILVAAPGLRRSCVRLERTPDGRGYQEASLAPGWLVWQSAPILVHFHSGRPADARKGLELCRRALRTAGIVLQRCWDPDEREYLAVLGREEAPQ